MLICEFIAFHMHHGCMKEKRLLKGCMKWKNEKEMMMKSKGP